MGGLDTGSAKTSKSTNVSSASELLNKSDILLHVGVVEALDPVNTGRIKVRVQEIDQGYTSTPTFCSKVNTNGTFTQKLNKVVNGSIQSSISFVSNLGEVINNTRKKANESLSDRVGGGEDTCNPLPWANALLPLHMQIRPKVGELVLVILVNRKNEKASRVWVGPLSPFVNEINFSGDQGAKITLNSPGVDDIDNGVKSTPKVKDFTGSLPEPSDIALMSRNNADIVLPSLSARNRLDKKTNITKGGEILLRAGKFKRRTGEKGNLVLNDENIAYFRLKQLKKPGFLPGARQPDTHAMLFADYISIVSHINGEEGDGENVRKINPIEDVSTDGGIRAVHNSLSPLIRGDQLVKYLELLRDYVVNHNHPYPKHPATNANSKPDIEKFDLNSLLSTNIRIN